MATVNENRLQLYLAAEARILSNQSVRVQTSAGTRDFTLADLAEVRAEIARLQRVVAQEQAAAAGRRGGISQADFGGEW